jgi:glutamate-5-semialdehyde dehydrogenase
MDQTAMDGWINQAVAASRRAATEMAKASPAQKNQVLMTLARNLRDKAPQIEQENEKDLRVAKEQNLSGALQDRLVLKGDRIDNLADAVEAIARLPDPVGDIQSLSTQPSGIQVGRMCVPLGVILIVYESRPNVTIDAGALCLKAGNAVILRGGKEARQTNQILATLLSNSLEQHGLPPETVTFVEHPDRDLLYALLKRSGDIDLAIPRGGTSLIDAVNAHARVPVVQHYQGICHVYVHEDAEMEQAVNIVVNAKVQRPGVCNAMECVVVDQGIAKEMVPKLAQKLAARGVSIRACAESRQYLNADDASVTAATVEDFSTEFLDLVCVMKVVKDYDACLAFLEEYGSRHTESIVTQNHNVAMRFLREVDASCVMVNASTRFNDGGELGLGAELGISTTKLHAYGPMGLEELCARKFVVLGHGETRGSLPE